MQVDFLAGKKASANPRTGGAQGENGRQPPSVANATRRDHRDRRYGVDYARHQGQRGNGTTDMTASLPTLSHDYVYAGVGRAFGFRDAADLKQNDRASRVETLHMGRWIAPVEANGWDALFQANLHLLFVGVGHEKVWGEGLRCQSAGFLDHLASRFRAKPGYGQCPKPASVGHRRGERGTRGPAYRCLAYWNFNSKPVAELCFHLDHLIVG